ncbi:MAG: STAS domain-containing protein, partial [Cyanobacteria bacterium P01_A01_bin.17]
GVQIIDWGFLWRICQVSFRAALVTYGVLLLTVFVDLITAVLVGAFVANILTIQRLTSLQISKILAVTHPDDDPNVRLTPEERRLMDQAQGRILLIQMSGPISYGAARTISYQMGRSFDILILDLSHVPLMGVTASLMVEAEVKAARRRQVEIYIVGARGQVKKRLQQFQVQDALPAANFLPACFYALEMALTLINLEGFKQRPVVCSQGHPNRG